MVLSQEIELLKLYGSMLVNMENRFLSASELSEAKKEIEVINSTLRGPVIIGEGGSGGAVALAAAAAAAWAAAAAAR